MDWYRKIPLFLLTLSISFSHASVCYGVKQNRLDASLYFYPVPFQASKSYPNLFFQVGSNIHVRDALTGEIKQILKLDEGERIADCDRDSALLYCPNQSNDDQVAYKRVDLDGTNESFIFKKIIIAGQKRNTQNISFINNKPYFFYETGDPVNKNYQFTVQSADSILWTETNGENETWNFNGCFSYKDKQIVAISVTVCQKEFFLKFFNLVTGKTINTLEGCFERIIPPNYNSPIIALNKCTTEYGLCLYDIEHNEIIYRKKISNWFYTSQLNGNTWITTIEDKSNQYNFGKSGPIRLIKVNSKGIESENLTFNPAIPNLPIYSCQMISDQVVGLVARYKTYFWNFRTNQKLCEFFTNEPGFLSSDMNFFLLSKSQFICIDNQTFNTVWNLDVAIPQSIIEYETKDKIYLLNNVIDCKNQCNAMQVRIVNKVDESVEPYEFFVSPFLGTVKDIYDSPYGLVFISRNNICSFAVGGIERFSIRDLWDLQSWKPMDDPRYVEIKYKFDRTYILDTKTGVIKFISTQQ